MDGRTRYELPPHSSPIANHQDGLGSQQSSENKFSRILSSLVKQITFYFVLLYCDGYAAIAKKKKKKESALFSVFDKFVLAFISQRPFLPPPTHTLLLFVRDKYHRGE
jgi:hypothetical protein